MTYKKIPTEELEVFLRKHKLWLKNEDGGEKADLREADLQGADLRWANLDFFGLPLWYGSLSANFDDRQLIQIAYHIVKAGLDRTNASKETKAELETLIDFANTFHRVNECGKIEKKEV